MDEPLRWSPAWRDEIWSTLDQTWDVVVIGGGITGAGIFRAASRSGLRTLLVEAHDFASGTSSRSSKLVHGGLRYLKNAQIKVTVQSVGERERLLDEGRGLINPLGFLYASYEKDKLPPWLFGAGLAVYDMLGLKWGHRRYTAADIHRLAPHLRTDTLVAGFRYFDAQTDDARLVLRVIQEGSRLGGIALNYTRVESILRDWTGRACGVAIRDMTPEGEERTREIQAALVINAAGAWANHLRGDVISEPRLRRLRGSHLVFSAPRFPLSRAISFMHPDDQRPVFAIPWEGVTLFGTTDVDHRTKELVNPAIDTHEFDYLMSALEYSFPSLALSDNDVISTFSGIRPVVDTGQVNPSKESREHVLWREDGLLTVTGGKLTTFRIMALDTLNAGRRYLPESPRFRRREHILTPTKLDDTAGIQLPRSHLLRLDGRYGADMPALLEAASPPEFVPLADCLVLPAELRWAALTEGVMHLDDLLLRRVRLGLLSPSGGRHHLPLIRTIIQPILGWDDRRWQKEVNAYLQLWSASYHLPGSAGQMVETVPGSSSNTTP